MERRKISRRRPRSVDDAEVGHCTLLSCNRLRAVSFPGKSVGKNAKQVSVTVSVSVSVMWEQRRREPLSPLLRHAHSHARTLTSHGFSRKRDCSQSSFAEDGKEMYKDL